MIFVSFPLKERKYWLIYKRQLFAAGKSVLRSMAAHIPRKLERLGVVPGVSKSKFLKSTRMSGVGGDGSGSEKVDGGLCAVGTGPGMGEGLWGRQAVSSWLKHCSSPLGWVLKLKKITIFKSVY